MATSDRRAKRFERRIVDFVEALVLQGREGEVFEGTVIDVDDHRTDRGVVSVPRVAVEAPATGELQLGEEQRFRVEATDLDRGRVLFATV